MPVIRDPFNVDANEDIQEMMRQFSEAQNTFNAEKEEAGESSPAPSAVVNPDDSGENLASLQSESLYANDVHADRSTSLSSNENGVVIPEDITWDDIANISSGKDEDGPRACASFSLDIINDAKNDLQSRAEATLENAEYQVYIRGGSAVFEITVPRENMQEIGTLIRMVDTYYQEYEENPNQEITMNFVPFAYEGQLSFLFLGLTYFSHSMDAAGAKLLAAFDNNQTITIEADAENIKYQNLVAMAEREARDKEAEIDNELYEAMEEEKRLKEENAYAETLKEEMSKLSNVDPLEDEEAKNE